MPTSDNRTETIERAETLDKAGQTRTTPIYRLKMEKDSVKKSITIISLTILFATTICSTTAYIIGSIHGVETRLGARIECIEKDVAIIKTVLLLKGVMPPELATGEKNGYHD